MPAPHYLGVWDTLWYYLVLPCTSSDSYSLAEAFFSDKSLLELTLTFLLMVCLLTACYLSIKGNCILQRLISKETVGGESGVQIVVSDGRPAPFLKIKAVAGADLELGGFAQQQGALRTLFINQLDLAVTTQHRGADAGADPLYHFVLALGGGAP